MRNGSPKPSLARIAAELGVSTASVSNALNRPERVSAELRSRVVAVATRIGYAGPAAAARLLPNGRADAVGLLFTTPLPTAFRDPAAVAFLEGLAASCESARLKLLVLPVGAHTPGAVSDAVVDGFIVYSLRDEDAMLPAVLDRGLPTVIVDAPRGVEGTDWVGSDDRAATRSLGAHLYSLGHRAVGILSPQLNEVRFNGPADPTRWRQSHYALMRSRIEGLHEGLRVDPGSTPIEERCDPSVSSGAEAMHALLDRRPDLTAVCCLTDVLALGALKAARQRGLSIPDQLTITGYDDIPEAARAGLTTVAQPHVEKGRIAGELYLTAPTRSSDRRRVLPTHLEIRTTSGRPRATR
jgi:DNA-binding LacI/PurR family transcriptional regulator